MLANIVKKRYWADEGSHLQYDEHETNKDIVVQSNMQKARNIFCKIFSIESKTHNENENNLRKNHNRTDKTYTHIHPNFHQLDAILEKKLMFVTLFVKIQF